MKFECRRCLNDLVEKDFENSDEKGLCNKCCYFMECTRHLLAHLTDDQVVTLYKEMFNKEVVISGNSDERKCHIMA